jgi:hypothetical protein
MKRLVWILSITVVLAFPLDVFAKGGQGNGKGPIDVAPSSVGNVVVISATGAADEESDRPEWAGVPGKDGKPGRGNDTPGVDKGEDYGDLWVIYRDGNGEPILGDEGCVQPIAAEGYLITMVFVEGKCELLEEDVDDVQEIVMGRLNIARSPADVLEASYDEALSTLNNAITIGLDGAGRLKVTIFDEVSGSDIEKRIDSPLENLALYKAMMLNGYLPGLLKTEEELGTLAHLLSGFDGTDDTPLSQADFRQAAAFLGGAADKAGGISLDLLITLNGFLGLNNKGNGSDIEYYDFTSFDYSAELRATTHEGRVETLLVVDDPEAPLMSASFHVANVSIAGIGFADLLDPYRKNLSTDDDPVPYLYFEIGGAWKFAQAADDALRAINFIHNFEVPEY